MSSRGLGDPLELELAAQQQQFAGVVIDEQGAPVEGAVVYVPAILPTALFWIPMAS
jgi:hypothetical protein